MSQPCGDTFDGRARSVTTELRVAGPWRGLTPVVMGKTLLIYLSTNAVCSPLGK